MDLVTLELAEGLQFTRFDAEALRVAALVHVGLVHVVELRQRQVDLRALAAAAGKELATLGLLHQVMSVLAFMQRPATLLVRDGEPDASKT